ncbi:hypothetical protein OAV47_00660 [bacterium]|nr:hypothetical protein [bacterium]
MTQVRILCVGDMHLGRVTARPAWGLESLSFGASEVSVRPGLEDAAREARQRRVAAALLAGEVVDSDDGSLA